MTLGHPGFVAYILYWLRRRYESRTRDGESLSYREIFLEVTNPDFIDNLKTTRASKNVDRLTREEIELCDEVFRSPGGLPLHNLSAESVYSFRRLRRTFLLTETHDEGRRRVLDFAAPILRTLFLHEKYGRITRASFAPTDFYSFLRDAFQNMDGKILRESLGRGTDGRVMETVWQNEFYRVATQLLSKDEVVSVNVGPVFKSEGYVDFFIGPKQKWAIELIGDGDRIQQHQARWDDIYCDFVAVANETVVVDMRQPGSSSRKSSFPSGFYMVEYLKDFEAVRITPPNGGQPEIVPLAGNGASSEGLLLPYQAR
ncbi:hypothetical protein BZG36_05138 [Bifiguratus adelaidae]|uniref:Uncharacterized protein n=1 Tax=Bifiguratus adelaidae TaxID=1938954 RepID=A0A261XVU2_9FUNG|nr:hypothetical protein BZG36_05138 [Bifiguratus adelaidae]